MKGPKQGIQLKQTQTLAVTPQLTQRLHILQCNQQDLIAEIQQMLDSNIMLEQLTHDEQFEFSELEETDEFQLDDTLDEDIPTELDIDADWDSLYDDDAELPKKMDDVDSFQADWVADHHSFDTRLERAIHLSELSSEQTAIAQLILSHLDEHYFLTLPAEQLAKQSHYDVKKISETIEIIKHLDPTGVASQSVQECLLAQLQTNNDCSEAAIDAHEIISECFHYLGKKPEMIRRRLDLSDSEYHAAIQHIQRLSPYPYTPEENLHTLIKPDLFVRQRMGFFYASANQDARFDIGINEAYASLTDACHGDEKQFMKSQLQAAKFFLKALDERQRTLIRVANAVVMQQQDYFIEGDSALKPLSMKTIAELVNINESTVSRAVSGKYVSFNHQLIELRTFFSHEVAGDEQAGTEATTATAIKAIIQSLIDKESPEKPLSDSKIEKILKEQNIDIARRTVTKYREALGIPKTSERKRRN